MRRKQHFAEGDEQAAFGKVVRGDDAAGADLRADEIVQFLFGLEIHRRRVAGFQAVAHAEEIRAAEFVRPAAEEEERLVAGFERRRGDVLAAVHDAGDGDGWRRVNRAGGAFVIQGDIAADDGHVECAAGFGEAGDGLAHHGRNFPVCRGCRN